MGALASTGEVAEDAVDDLVNICENHYNGEDLTKGPCGVDEDYTAMIRRISLHLDHGQCARMPLR
jgi:hypothetical protein